ncbi:cellulosomal serpin [Clostridium sp. CAG:762]|nr:cellulosomal serpin [Clostridium sp. CAG:762]
MESNENNTTNEIITSKNNDTTTETITNKNNYTTTETTTNKNNDTTNEIITNKNNETTTETTNVNKNNKNKKKKIIIIAIILLIVATLGCIYFFKIKDNNTTTSKVGDKKDDNSLTDKDKDKDLSDENYNNKYKLSGNSLEDFDLYFLQLENERKNKVYSPLSIKYALSMLNEGANGKTKKQISSVIGDYNAKKYSNNSNMSFANALFIRDSFKDSIKDSYINTLSNKYNAEVIFDSFKTPNKLNSWVSNKTFKLINNLFDDVSQNNFILANALAIDMEWVNVINDLGYFAVSYQHENYWETRNHYHESTEFDGNQSVDTLEIMAVANKYDIVNIFGEQNIRDNITKRYQDWLNSEEYKKYHAHEENIDVETYVNNYIKEINKGYKDLKSSTDFEFYVDNDIKVFAKDLKEYNGITLQYVGIMPKNDSLDNYIKNTNAFKINAIINKLKPIKLESFKEGVITEIRGNIPMFKFDYDLNIKEDLQKLGITNVFDSNKADLSNISSSKNYIEDAKQKTNIEFANEGIKAAAVTYVGDFGTGVGGFDYLYDVPVEKINLDFDKPYMFIIRDKNSGEVWFTGTVYEPTEYVAGQFEW